MSSKSLFFNARRGQHLEPNILDEIKQIENELGGMEDDENLDDDLLRQIPAKDLSHLTKENKSKEAKELKKLGSFVIRNNGDILSRYEIPQSPPLSYGLLE